MKRALSSLLFALHLVVYALGGTLALAEPARALGHRSSNATVTGGYSSDGTTITSSTDPRIDRAARARGDRGERGSGAPPLDAFVPHTAVTIAPASETAPCATRALQREQRPAPSLVNAPRGPPQAV